MQLNAQYDRLLFFSSKLQGLQIQFFCSHILNCWPNCHKHVCAVNIYAPLYGHFHGLLLYCQNKPYINLISVVIWLCSILLFAQCSSVSSSSLHIPHRTHTVHCITSFMPNCYFSQSMYLTENIVCHNTKNQCLTLGCV